MQHGPAAKLEQDNSIAQKSKLGLWLFGLYTIVYAGFVIINTIDPNLMETIICCGLNLAVVYGFFLIIFAIILGLIYNHLCTKMENKLNIKKENL